MAAARQKEINVSITEDATISRTRSEGGATVVREDPIASSRHEAGSLPSLGGAVFNRTPCDEFISELPVSQQDRFSEIALGRERFIPCRRVPSHPRKN